MKTKPFHPRKTAQGSELEKGITLFQHVSSLIMGNLIASGIQEEDFQTIQQNNEKYRGLTGDQYFAKRSCELTVALMNEWIND